MIRPMWIKHVCLGLTLTALGPLCFAPPCGSLWLLHDACTGGAAVVLLLDPSLMSITVEVLPLSPVGVAKTCPTRKKET